MLEFHDREEKARWWEFFRLRDLREDERAAITGLTCVESRTEMRSFVHRDRFRRRRSPSRGAPCV
jgi:hypothetical protein